ncbi:hypothetical protein Bca101_009327 [Brassica carinata]
MDRISSLPDDVSHVRLVAAVFGSAQTSVLSKRWRILFAFSSNLDLLEYKNDARRRFTKFVDRVLAVSGNSPIKKFTLSCRHSSRTNRRIHNVLNRGSVLDLDLHLGIDDAHLPSEIFACKTLVELKLTGFCIKELPDDALLPALKKLVLKSVQFDLSLLHVCAFEKLLSACPVLEELVLDDLRWELWKWSRSVSSHSLRKLTIKRTDFDGYDLSDLGNITFDTPSVTHLDYYDFVATSYLVANLNSLVEANLDLVVTVNHSWHSRFAEENDNITSNPANLLKGLRNVQIMNLLSQESLDVTIAFFLSRMTSVPEKQNLAFVAIVVLVDLTSEQFTLAFNQDK